MIFFNYFSMFFFFFFSSRRRHTRLVSDWSSDVCSSDLLDNPLMARFADHAQGHERIVEARGQARLGVGERDARARRLASEPGDQVGREIGRASCRERV